LDKTVPFEKLHADGSIWARGQTLDGEMHGYWEFFRKDGTVMRRGHLDRGVQVGEWTTLAKDGSIVKTTRMKAK
jgi:antitoxin component YwqK of YwqJK toxin-antitoxin module